MRRIVILLIASAVLVSSPALARSKGGDVAKAKRLFKQAEEHFAKEEYRKALELYEQAYEAKPLAGFHFNIAQCHRALGEYRPAIEHFEQYLAKSDNPQNKADAERLLQLSRDALAEEERQKALEQEEPVPEPAPVVAPPPKPTPEPPKSRRRLRPLYFWSGVGVTGGLLLIGTITGAMALSKSSEFNDTSTPYGDLQDLKDSGESLRTASTVTFTLGLVAAAGTAALYFFTDFSGGKEKAVAASPIPGGAVVTAVGRF